jgi:predicted alpha-1,2-mannosidase
VQEYSHWIKVAILQIPYLYPMRKFLLFFIFFPAFIFAQNYADYVDPFIGTGGTGHTYPGATLPHGMVQLSPDTRIDGSWEGCSGYHYSDPTVYGFSHTHLSGTGCSDYGDVMLMPVTKKTSAYTPADYGSIIDRTIESSKAGFYSVRLENHQVTANLTATLRTGFHQYIYHEAQQAMVVLDLNHRDQLLEGKIEMINDHTIAGYRYSKAWARNQKVFFYIEFSRKIASSSVKNGDIEQAGVGQITGTSICANFFFDIQKNDTLLIKVGISGTSIEGAQLNLQTENPGWDFAGTYQKAKDAWNKELGKIEITAEKRSDYTVFYTALYHTAIVPNVWNDVDGKYRGMDDTIHTRTDGNMYTVFSLWDTFRAAHPLYTLIDRGRATDYVLTFIQQYKESGKLPVWELSANETNCMIGIHSISVIADAVAKGLVPDSYKDILAEAMISTSKLDYRGLKWMAPMHHLTVETESESVSKTLEYCYQYYCMAQVCKWAGRPDKADEFEWICLGYKDLFDQDTGFFVPRANGGWLEGFDPTQVNNYFTEANAWQYTFFVLHDIKGMINLYGGREKFHAKLDSMFGTSSKMTGREQADITGLIGQYAHGNEPSHHVAYLYNYTGDFRTTNKIVTKICKEFYTTTREGLSGNEDCGQMSAWYVLSSLGLYEVDPGSPYYTITIPQVSSSSVHLENGKILAIQKDKGDINRITWNGKTLNRLYLSYDELVQGGLLRFEATNTNQLSTDIEAGDILNTSSIAKSESYVPAPVIVLESASFEKEAIVKITTSESAPPVFYEIMYGPEHKGRRSTGKKYTGPFKVKENCSITAYYQEDHLSTASASLYKLRNNYTIEIKSIPKPEYFAGGAQGLLDGIHGEEDWRKGNWQGYQGQDFEAVINLQKEQVLKSVTCTFLCDSNAWIFFPTEVELLTSSDGIYFTLYSKAGFVPNDEKGNVQDISFNLMKTKTRYIKVIAKNYGLLPKGHPGEGFPAYIFIDEIEIW